MRYLVALLTILITNEAHAEGVKTIDLNCAYHSVWDPASGRTNKTSGDIAFVRSTSATPAEIGRLNSS
jgi:hypothetical protein